MITLEDHHCAVPLLDFLPDVIALPGTRRAARSGPGPDPALQLRCWRARPFREQRVLDLPVHDHVAEPPEWRRDLGVALAFSECCAGATRFWPGGDVKTRCERLVDVDDPAELLLAMSSSSLLCSSVCGGTTERRMVGMPRSRKKSDATRPAALTSREGACDLAFRGWVAASWRWSFVVGFDARDADDVRRLQLPRGESAQSGENARRVSPRANWMSTHRVLADRTLGAQRSSSRCAQRRQGACGTWFGTRIPSSQSGRWGRGARVTWLSARTRSSPLVHWG